MDNQEKPKKNGGRPRIELRADEILKLGERQWTDTEIAAHYSRPDRKVSHDVISKRFGDELKQARERGIAKLKDVFWRHATGAKVRDEHGNIVSTKTSERILVAAMDRYVGPVEQKVKQDGKIEVTISDYRSKKEGK